MEPENRTPTSSFLRQTSSQRRKTLPLFDIARMNFGGSVACEDSVAPPIFSRAPLSEMSRMTQEQIRLPFG